MQNAKASSINGRNAGVLILDTLKRIAIPVLIFGCSWIILGLLRALEINNTWLWPLNFITGALAGIDGGSYIGGIIGKSLLLMMVSGIIIPMIRSRKSKKEIAKAGTKKVVVGYASDNIPYFSAFKGAMSKKLINVSYILIGVGFAIFSYGFITGNGSLQNSMVCILAAFSLLKALKGQCKLFIALLNKLLVKNNKNKVDPKYVGNVVAGMTLGFALSIPMAAMFGSSRIAYTAGFFITIVGAVIMIYTKKKGKIAALAMLFILSFSMASPVFAYYYQEVFVYNGVHYLYEIADENGNDINHELNGVKQEELVSVTLCSTKVKPLEQSLLGTVDEPFEILLKEGDEYVDTITLKKGEPKDFTIIKNYINPSHISNIEADKIVPESKGRNNPIVTRSYEYQCKSVLLDDLSFNNWNCITTVNADFYYGEMDSEGWNFNTREDSYKVPLIAIENNSQGYARLVRTDQNPVLGVELEDSAMEFQFGIVARPNMVKYKLGDEEWKTCEDMNSIADLSLYVPVSDFKTGPASMESYDESYDQPVSAGGSIASGVVAAALATVGVAAASSVTAAFAGGVLNIEGETNAENENEIENDETGASYSIVLNNGVAVPNLCNTKDATVHIPVRVKNGELLNWQFICKVTSDAGKLAEALAVNVISNDSGSIGIKIKGADFDGYMAELNCLVTAIPMNDAQFMPLIDQFDLKLYKVGEFVGEDGKTKIVTEGRNKGIAEITDAN